VSYLQGSYLILLSLSETKKIKIGKFGLKIFDKGYYIYIGSAMGKTSTSLEKRLIRHISTVKNKEANFHWHIDYLLADKKVSICAILISPNQNTKEECDFADLIKLSANYPIDKFGSSDCTCKSHLYYFTVDNTFIHKLLQK
jgi:Uri superfamily endonuclease